MTEIAPSIDLELADKLKNPVYRRKFFLAETSTLIAEQLIKLRKRRNLSQIDLAEKLGTKQPAICRVEQADYRSWSFRTLLGIADALDARMRIVIEAYEDIVGEYKDSNSSKTKPSTDASARITYSSQHKIKTTEAGPTPYLERTTH